MGEKVCIECGNLVYGKKAVKVKDDIILKILRDIKRATKTAKENELYVCEDDLKKNQQKRSEFLKSMLIFGIAAAAVLLLSLVSIILSGVFNIGLLLFGFVVAATILLLVIITKYTPAVENTELVLIEGNTKAQQEVQSMMQTENEKKTGKNQKIKKMVRKWQKK
ncbi:MAG: hypothetical protein QXF35_02150 [Candidatus Bilamarchaeaceae archaeon]